MPNVCVHADRLMCYVPNTLFYVVIYSAMDPKQSYTHQSPRISVALERCDSVRVCAARDDPRHAEGEYPSDLLLPCISKANN